MPKCMHLVPGLSSLNTRKSKIKITKKRMLELKEEHKLHNKKYKHDKHLSSLMIMDFDTYIKYRFGKIKYKKKFIPMTEFKSGNTDIKKTYPIHNIKDMSKCTKPNDDYKREISSQYIIGQAYNKSGFQVLSKKEANDPATGKRR